MGSAIEEIISQAANQHVLAVKSLQQIVPGGAIQTVVAAVSGQLVGRVITRSVDIGGAGQLDILDRATA